MDIDREICVQFCNLIGLWAILLLTLHTVVKQKALHTYKAKGIMGNWS